MDDDRKIPAVKLFASQLDRARRPLNVEDIELEGSHVIGLVLDGVYFTRVWLQVIPDSLHKTHLDRANVRSIMCLMIFLKLPGSKSCIRG